MPARPARCDDDVVEAQKLFVRHVESAELRGPLLAEETPAHAVLDRLGLLEDLLEHEMIEAAALYLVQVPFDAVHASRELPRAEVDHPVSVAREYGEVAIVEIH